MSPSTIASIVGWALFVAGLAVLVYSRVLADKEHEQRQVEQFLRERRERLERER
ncbi:hypothetical protein [Myxococcus sp. AS-1-15]|jgi:biopolymer transport protein ExbB/TolQ|uniref:hypothetical protein n=1 Tax=Myxococcus sp. AS-1-15 TaxID=2874600 RepID=UPI001CBAFE37|nr:hypothetical protein [Myxococcus sp. AS-1-15]MBZ4398648.1 hypothetical protein [Myxococcus sp. AS-1-15]